MKKETNIAWNDSSERVMRSNCTSWTRSTTQESGSARFSYETNNLPFTVHTYIWEERQTVISIRWKIFSQRYENFYTRNSTLVQRCVNIRGNEITGREEMRSIYNRARKSSSITWHTSHVFSSSAPRTHLDWVMHIELHWLNDSLR